MSIRDAQEAKFGKNVYQSVFAPLIFTGLLLIILGWRSATPAPVYTPVAGFKHPAMLLAMVGIILFVASNFPAGSSVSLGIRN